MGEDISNRNRKQRV